jgi:hypothetical protein
VGIVQVEQDAGAAWAIAEDGRVFTGDLLIGADGYRGSPAADCNAPTRPVIRQGKKRTFYTVNAASAVLFDRVSYGPPWLGLQADRGANRTDFFKRSLLADCVEKGSFERRST